MSTVTLDARRRRLGGAVPSAVAPVALAVVVVLVAVALLAPVLAPHSPDDVDLLAPYAGPSSAHLLGTDATGRDLLSRLLLGSRTALLGPAIVVAVAGLVGVAVALAGAWWGGWRDTLVARALDVLLGVPGILLALVAVALFGRGLPTAALALGVAYVPYVARVVRAEALRQRTLPYVAAAVAQGRSGAAIAVSELLPNLTGLIAAQLTLAFGYATVDVAALSYLGLGVQDAPDWGAMVAGGQPGLLDGHPAESLAAGGLLVVLVLAVLALGDRLTEVAMSR